MAIRQLSSTDAVIDEFGGTAAFSRLLGVRPTRVSNWRVRGRFPPETYVALTALLKARRLRAPDRLWGQRAAVSASVSACG